MKKGKKKTVNYNSVMLDFLEFLYRNILSYLSDLLATLGPVFGFYLINKEKLGRIKAEKSK